MGTVMECFSLQGKTAIVTGAGRGIGKAIALGMAEAGARVAAVARTPSEIEATASEIASLGGDAIAVPADVTAPDQMAATVGRVLEKWGGVDILVNNAGGTFFAPFLDIEEAGWDAIIRKNLKSVYVCCREVGRVMVRQGGGSIINISSVGGIGPYPDSASYGAAKAGIIHLTQTVATALGPHNVRVNCIAPGVIATEGVIKRFNDPANVALGERYLKRTPLKRRGRPEEVASVAIFFASDASSFVTGQTLIVGGGIQSLEGE